MANIVEVTLNNRLSDGLPDFLMKVSDGSPHLKAGMVAGSPRDVSSLTIKPFNAGVYQSSASNPAIEGVVAYTLPGISKSMLFIYFSNSKCRLLLLPDNTSVTADIIDQAEEEDRETAEGSLVSQGMTINWTAKEDRSIVGNATQYIVTRAKWIFFPEIQIRCQDLTACLNQQIDVPGARPPDTVQRGQNYALSGLAI
ncbi:hypothetical protein B0H17DRAFT_1143943 [Mycena rosella]|uniref:Uncharacterized protein n=1 Tax=Mycena rosella TaxID=1033263 RepID=A0AAD7CU72_MYCRO|nr:hypothetical protein B0H17DRAFT_1143943 [Mycena rosella]